MREIQYLLVIDQGTTSTRAILFDQAAQPIQQQAQTFQQYFPHNGWVEHDPEEIFTSALNTCRQVIKKTSISVNKIAGIGITNQRETTLIWRRDTGQCIYPAIVWQDRRTAAWCEKFKPQQALIQEKTGLLLDAYFSASKIAWILDQVPEARQQAERGELAFGTIESFLLWRLTKGKVHATDVTNASRTLLFNLKTQQWDKELLSLFQIPEKILPDIKDNCADFGRADVEWFDQEIAIVAMAGDQQAALIGQTCFQPDSIKSTYGTGCFMLLNTGDKILQSHSQLITTMAYRFHGHLAYALEGSIFAAGTIVQWLRDKLGLLKTAEESAHLAASVENNAGVYLVPAFTGLGAPYWNPNCRAAIFGLTRDTDRAHIVRAGLEAIAYQSYDLLHAMMADGMEKPKTLRVDGGMAANAWLMQFLADILEVCIEKAAVIETTALGVAYLAGLQTGLFKSLEEVSQLRQIADTFSPKMSAAEREKNYQGWQVAVKKLL